MIILILFTPQKSALGSLRSPSIDTFVLSLILPYTENSTKIVDLELAALATEI